MLNTVQDIMYPQPCSLDAQGNTTPIGILIIFEQVFPTLKRNQTYVISRCLVMMSSLNQSMIRSLANRVLLPMHKSNVFEGLFIQHGHSTGMNFILNRRLFSTLVFLFDCLVMAQLTILLVEVE